MISASIGMIIALVGTWILTPAVRDWALRRGVVDEPGGRRVHVRSTPRLGGIAMVVAFFLALAVLMTSGTSVSQIFLGEPERVLGLLAGGLVVALVGGVDDVQGIGAWPKLMAQAVAACLAYAFGYRIDAIDLPLIGIVQLGVFALPVTVGWFLGIINALNLIDGLDGLAAGIALFAATANAVIGHFNGQHMVVWLSVTLAGCLLGFLRYNFNPASIFMGDAGSMFLGFVLAATSIVGSTVKSSTAVAIVTPLVTLGVPVFDTLLAMVRRAMARQPIFSADRGHIHHKLLDLGLTHRRAVLFLYGSSVALCVSAIAIAFGRSWHVGVGMLVVATVVATLARTARRGYLLRLGRVTSSAEEIELNLAERQPSVRLAARSSGEFGPLG